uniref:DNA gyrase subunit A n=1 Tax=Candidatus Aschnera chinzeii TaxID=1485666 RepID=A0AAT9G4J2_9ENTR|nr:MAG: DNA topoisomerase (ATP-hydrolyzing) subunit A [Candidatus Aschnera chinzeii]
MDNIAKEITTVDIEEELKNSYLDYAMSVIVGRAIPDVRDGLKPVHRRILYAMNILGNHWNKTYKKSARIVGDVIGKYHPHGDTAVYETIVRLAQSFSMRYPLIDGQGNFGSIDGDSAAAMRYTEIRMTKLAHELLKDLEQNTIEFIDNYDGTEKIPNILPSRIPNLLINGSSGIAVGMATNIPPNNFSEVINGCLAYIENNDITINELLNHIQGPDFPTAAIINGRKGIINAYSTGRGIIYIRARTQIDKDHKTGRETIIINQIPYQVNKARLIEKIAELVKLKRIHGISTIRDESDKDGMRIVIEVKRDTIGTVLLNNLFRLTQLEISYGINMVALCDGQPKLLNLKDIIKEFINHRKNIIIKRTSFKLNKALDRLHILEGLAIALLNIDLIITLIRTSSSTNEAKNKLINNTWKLKKFSLILENINNELINNYEFKNNYNISQNQYYLTEKQVNMILELRLYRLTNLEYDKILAEYNNLIIEINTLSNILTDLNSLINVIRQELELVKADYHDVRKTEIIDQSIEINTEDLIHQEDVVVTLSHFGYIKYQSLTEYEAQKRGGKGKLAAKIKECDFINFLIIANTHDIILCFSNYGRIYWMKVYQLPKSTRISIGQPIINLLPLKNNERITTILPIHQFIDNYHIFMATKYGIVKKVALNDFSRPRNSGINAINLHEGDELIGVNLTNGNDDVMLFTTDGKVVRFSETMVRSMGRNAAGVKGISLHNKDKVVSLIIPQKNSNILTVTENGYGKITEQSKYTKKSRGTQGVISIKVTKRNGNVIGAIQVKSNDQIVLITNAGTLVRIRVTEISIMGRNTSGVTLIKTQNDEKVVSLQRINDLTKIN